MARIPSFMYKKYKKEKCELCGSDRALEVHHIFPLTLQSFLSEYSNGTIDLNEEDNCITVCSGCHGLLTNKSLYTKIGIACSRWEDNSNQKVMRFYKTLHELSECVNLDAIDVLNVFDSIFVGTKEKDDI